VSLNDITSPKALTPILGVMLISPFHFSVHNKVENMQ